jgi:hypothetical protein
MASLCSADVDVVVNLVGADAVDRSPVESVRNFVDFSSMDNSDLFVAMCLPGTFSSDNEGVCHDCQLCKANQYETQACIPTRDRACANCTVCGSNDIELCQCAVKTSQCVTGDRVCLRVPPTVVTLVVDFTSNGVLTAKQQTFVRSGLALGYTDWLASEFDVDPETVELTDFVRTGTLTYKAYFRFNEVYGQAKISSIQSQTQEFFQGGLVYTFGGGGGRRRLLQAGANLMSVNGVSSDCGVNATCSEAFTEFRYDNGTNCSGSCYPILCPPGLTGSAKNCFPCGPGTYKNETGYQDCQECPAGYTSPTAANSSEACTPLPPNSTTTSAAETTTAGQSTPSPTPPSSSPSATSPPPSSSPSAQTTSSSAPLPPSSSSSTATSTLSTAQPTASQAGSSPSSAPSAGSSSTGQAVPQTTPPGGSGQTTPSGGTGQTTGTSSGTGAGSPSSVVVSNVNTNTNNVNVNLPPAPAPVYVSLPTAQPAPPQIYITIAPQQAPPAPVIKPVFNNYFSQQPQPQAKQRAPMHETHTHHYYDDWDLSSLFLLLVFFVLVISFTLCIIYAVDDPVYHQYQPLPQRRVRFRIVRDPDTVSV